MNNYFYTGHEKDYETDLTYMLSRYYSQGYGRFLSPDPGYDYDQLDPMSWNLYSYVRGNPVRFIDLTGMDITEFIKLVNDTGIDKILEENHNGAVNEYYVRYAKNFFGMTFAKDEAWGIPDKVKLPDLIKGVDYIIDGHTHPHSDQFFSGDDIIVNISHSLLKGKESFNYAVLVNNKGSFGIEVEPQKLSKIKNLENVLNNIKKEINNLQRHIYNDDVFTESMKSVFKVLKKYNLLNAIHFYKKDKNGKWVEIDPTRYLEKEKDNEK